MRLNRQTGFFLGVLVLVIGVALFLLNAPANAPDVPTTSGETLDVFAGTTLTDIHTLAITDNASNLSVTFTQDAQGVWTQENASEPLRQSELDDAIGDLLRVRASDSFTAEDLAPYGLDTPAYTVSLSGDNVSFTLRLGNNNPAATRTYALIGDDDRKVYLLNGVSQLNRITAFLLNPPVVVVVPTATPSLETAGILFAGFAPSEIVTLTLEDTQAAATLTLTRDEGGAWQVAPSSTGAVQDATTDELLVEAMFNTLQFLSAVDVLRDVDAATVGLDTPRYTLRAERADGYAYTLAVGANDISGTRAYVRIFDLPNVAVVNVADLEALTRFIGNPPYERAEATPESTP